MNILQALIQTKNDIQEWVMDNLTNKVDKEDGKGLSSNDFTTGEKEKLAGINSFSSVKIGESTIEADNINDVLTLESGDNVALTLDDENATITISATVPDVDYPVVSVNNKTGAVELTATDIGALSKTGGTMSGDIDMDGSSVINTANIGFSAQNTDGDNISVLTLQPVLVEEDNSVYLHLQDEYNGSHTVGIQNVAPPIDNNDAANKSYVDEEIVSSINAIPQIYSSTSEPTSAVGKDGDIWIVYS